MLFCCWINWDLPSVPVSKGGSGLGFPTKRVYNVFCGGKFGVMFSVPSELDETPSNGDVNEAGFRRGVFI